MRLAQPGDAEAAIEVVRRSITQLCAADHRGDPDTLAGWLANKTPQNFRSWIANDDNHCVAACLDGAVVGVGLLHRSGEIRLFYLAPQVQHQGIGSAIHAALERKAVAWGLPTLQLDSTDRARPFYEALGYWSAGPAVPFVGVARGYPCRKTLRAAGP